MMVQGQGLSFVSDLASVICPSDARRKYIVVLSFYLDNSGDTTDKNETIFAVGGCIARAERWEKFDEQWRIALDDAEIPIFHATDFFARKIAPFNAWSDTKHKKFARRFSAIAENHFLAGVGRAVEVTAYKKIVHPARFIVHGFYLMGIQTPNFPAMMFCAKTCLERIARYWPDRPKGEPVAVVFERGQGMGAMINYFQFLQKEGHWLPEICTYTDAPKSFRPLQAADLMAYVTRQNYVVQTESSKRQTREILQRLARRDHISIKLASERGLLNAGLVRRIARVEYDALRRALDAASGL